MIKYLLLVACLGLSACGSSNSGSTGSTTNNTPQAACAGMIHLGIWHEPVTGETVTLYADCSGTSDICASTFKFSPVKTSKPHPVSIEILTTNGGPSCLPVGVHACVTTVYGSQDQSLDLNCGGMTVGYQR